MATVSPDLPVNTTRGFGS